MNVHRLVLTEDQSAFLRECGKHFVVISPGSYPASTGRMVLHIVECGIKPAADACKVALGQARAIKAKPGPSGDLPSGVSCPAPKS